MRYRIVHATNYYYSEAVPLCQNEVHLQPRPTRRQKCLRHRFDINPMPHRVEDCQDYFGNPIHFFTIAERHEQLSVTVRSEVELTPSEFSTSQPTAAWENVRETLKHDPAESLVDVRQFVFESPHVKIDARLTEYAARSFPAGRPWLEATMDLMARIHREFAYDPTATSVSTPLETVLELKRGVCQDFAHLQIGCLRALGLPARYVSGYLLTTPPPGQPKLVGADASHAWLSAWCPGLGWVDFDPTNNVVPAMGHVTSAWGRDYSDVCPIKGVFVGGGEHRMSVSVDVEPLHT
jgi:transglutaminase-like putative cysteine protease